MKSPFIIDFQISKDHVSNQNFEDLIAIYEQNHQFTKQQMIAFFNTLIFESRLKLLSIGDGTMTNLCDTAQSMIGRALEEVGIPVRVLDIGSAIDEEALGHSILIADVPCENRVQPLLIDITYQQFCLPENCNASCYFEKDGYILMSPHPGYFALQNNERKETIKALLEHGYLPWNETVAKHYCDTFYLSKTGKKEEIMNRSYTGKEYLEFTCKSNTKYSKTEEQLKKMDLWQDMKATQNFHKNNRVGRC